MDRRLANMIGIGKVTSADDTGEVQMLQITQGAAGSGFMDRVLDNVRRFFAFGFTSVPPLDAEALLLSRGGARACTMVIGINHRPSRPTGLSPGDTAMYDIRGAILKFTAAGPVLDCAGLPLIIQNTSKITLDCPDVDLTGNLAVQGTITGLTGSAPIELGVLRDAYNEHHHTGVSTGSGTSGATDKTL